MRPPHNHRERTLNIVGKLVALGPFVRDDLALYHRWINDFEVTRYYLDTPRPQTLEERAAWYERMSAGNLNDIDFADLRTGDDAPDWSRGA